jgi:primosomal protein N' (replication factor Y)
VSERVASVLLPMPLPEAFDYAVPEGWTLAVGDQVAAPLGPRTVRGVVTALRDAHGMNRPLKPLSAKLEEAALPAGTLAFVEWAARYGVQAPGEALAMALRGACTP